MFKKSLLAIKGFIKGKVQIIAEALGQDNFANEEFLTEFNGTFKKRIISFRLNGLEDIFKALSLNTIKEGYIQIDYVNYIRSGANIKHSQMIYFINDKTNEKVYLTSFGRYGVPLLDKYDLKVVLNQLEKDIQTAINSNSKVEVRKSFLEFIM